MTVFRDFHGQRVSRLGLGCTNFGKRIDAAGVDAVVRAALDAGVTFIDTADAYGDGEGEALLGRALRGRRDEAIIATKFGHDSTAPRAPEERGGHPANVISSAEASLRALGTDRIDLYQMHVPDPQVPVAETLGALQGLVTQGKVRWIGCSNVTLAQLEQAGQAAAQRQAGGFQTVQNEYSLLVRDAEQEVLPWCREHDLAFIPYFPLASGVLTGKYRMDARVPEGSRVALMKPDKLFRFFTPRALELVERIIELGERHGRSPLEYAYGFLLAEPAVLSIISGAMTPGQVEANAGAAAAAAELSGEELDYLRKVSQ
ncbi:MAG TPA: aldo/keto reductase [Streptosporangiaceae bacterium]|jgi:aryl-alcohol dehydrogenase-like predicted oxidoreductase